MNDSQLQRHFHLQQENLLGLLYSSVLNDSQWQSFLKALVKATDSRSARMLLLNEEANKVLYSTKVNIDDRDHQRYVNHYVNACPWRRELSRKASGRLYSTYYEFSCRQPEFYRTEFFNDWAREQDIHHGVCGTVYQTGAQKVQLLVQRTRGQGHYSPHATGLINGLLPHVRQALRLSQQTQTRIESLNSAAQVAGQRTLPFILLDQNAQVVYASPRCEPLLTEGDVAISQGCLSFRVTALQRRFQDAFNQVSRSVEGQVSQEHTLDIRRDGRSTLHCMLTPVHPCAELSGFWPGSAYVAVYLYCPELTFTIDKQELSRLYSLTNSEAQIATDIALGLEPQFIAERDNRSANTVRTQLKSVYRKTGCCRQNELAALILQSPAARQS